MRKLIGVVALGMILSTTTFAQQEPHQHQRGQRDASPEERVDKRVSRLTEKLALTAEQQEEIREFHLELMKAGKASMSEGKNWEKRGEIREAHRKLMDQKMETVLSAEQLEKYDQMKTQRKEKSGKKHGHRSRSRE